MTDDDLLGYVEIHSRTELALFSLDHVQRLLMLAGKPPLQGLRPAFLSVKSDVATELVRLARNRLGTSVDQCLPAPYQVT